MRNPTCECTICQTEVDGNDCCGCVCSTICVNLLIYPDECSVELEWDTASQSYHGSIACQDVDVDLELTFECADGDCKFCLSSYCLGLIGDDKLCVPMATPADRNGPTCLEPEATFEVDLSGCALQSGGGGEGIITTHCVELIRPAEAGCKKLCEGCDCACACLCLTYVSTKCFAKQIVCWDEEERSWSATIACDEGYVDLTITIEENEYTGECELVLESAFHEFGPEAEPLDCPDISAEWLIPLGDYQFATVSVRCAHCNDECVSTADPTCPECCDSLAFHFPPPDVELVATIDAPDCVGMHGKTAILTRKASDEQHCQIFSGGNSIGPCPLAMFPFAIGLLCPELPAVQAICNNYWASVFWGSSSCAPHSMHYHPPLACSCDPIYFEFQVDPATQRYPTECDCCDPDAVVKIIITE